MRGLPEVRVLHVDSWLVAVDKPSGVPSVPARDPREAACVARRLNDQFGPLEAVHRLDRDTSGVLVLARHHEARVAMGRVFERRLVSKRYLAVCCGRPPSAVGEVMLPLAPDLEQRPRQRVDPIHGRPSHTRWTLLASESEGSACHSLLELEPLTGRSHQLRVHMAWLGLPILGDPLYGHRSTTPFARLALHAATLCFPHPQTGDELALHADGDLVWLSPSLQAAHHRWWCGQNTPSVGRMADARTFDQ